ncbi:ribonuclease catalytic domain-containing protein [Methylovorus sp. MP688]|uniref:ribonuclease catalytic domain-containing protein n=1 Tax=Methylovorus sp. (strain MP688) TaxID=887061 RepID=UPI0001EC4550|nr:RNB domain-containing ribonuclease [Methylovorus sp. MP688]ADQ84098.1 ribonuclease II [Methylovorus sp. MP688]
MNVFYEEDGGFKVAAIMTENPGSLQVEALTGKRSKIKSANVLMKFEQSLSGFMEAANAEAEQLDIPFLWECCGEDEFAFDALAQDYYGQKPTPVQSAAVAIRLHSAPVYFYRKGKGHYKAAPADTLNAALAAIEKKRLQAEKIATFAEQLKAGELPEEFRSKLDMLFYDPDKNSMEWKALEQAAAETHTGHVQVLAAAGAIASIHDYHLGAFLREYFPKGTGFDAVDALPPVDDLPLAEVEAFSIDDSTTTEIDDALSVTPLGNGLTRVGIHIAAPALGILPDSPLDAVALHRLSTVYMPGNKITMLPEEAIEPFSLNAGHERPALSLYLDVAADFSIVHRESRVERVRIVENLRHDALEPYFNEATLAEDSGHPYWARLLFLFNLAEALEKARGKYDPTRPPQLDYNFYVTDGKVQIVARRRGSPMDKLVAELMIEANSQWGLLLKEHAIPGIYRAQNGGKVYMTTQAEPHQGLGVGQYAWSTSPLRRAVDLINQRQVISVLRAEPPVYPPNSDLLASAMRNFDQTYNAYNEFQTRMERYWCLQYLVQENIQEIGATVWRENLVRLDNLPYITKVHSLPELAPGTRVKLEIRQVDTLMMELDTRFKGVETPVAEVANV